MEEPREKRCPGCGLTKPLDEFCRDKKRPTGKAPYCRICHTERNRESRIRNGGARRYKLRAKYGIEPADFDTMVAAQGGVCAACRVAKPEHVDHDHATGRIRGILCVRCNSGLGMLGDDPERLERAIAYLEGVLPWQRG